jgi:hypothetical protein
MNQEKLYKDLKLVYDNTVDNTAGQNQPNDLPPNPEILVSS